MESLLRRLACPKDPAVLKLLRRSNFTIAVVIPYLWRFSCEFSPGKLGVSETLPWRFATTVVNYHDRSIFSMTGSLFLCMEETMRHCWAAALLPGLQSGSSSSFLADISILGIPPVA